MTNEKIFLDNAEFKIAMATESEFEKQVNELLGDILLKLNSPDPTIKQKVMSLCSHINKRFKSMNIQLPVERLVDIYITSGLAVQSFALIYLEMGFPLLDSTKQMKLLPLLVQNISSRPVQQQQILFGIAIPILTKYSEGNTVDFEQDPFQFYKNEADLKFWLSKFLDVMLYRIPVSNRGPITALNQAQQKTERISPLDQVPAGMSKYAVQFITNNLKAAWTWNHDALTKTKVELVRFLMIQKLVPLTVLLEDRYLLYIVGSVDSNHQVQFICEDSIRRSPKPNFENPEFIKKLYQLYQGTPGLADDYFRSPSVPLLKQKVIDGLCRSALAANLFPNVIQVAFDALYGDQTIAKLKTSGMSFVQWIARMADAENLKNVAPYITLGLLKTINDPSPNPLKGFAYEAVGLLAKRVPEYFAQDLELLFQFFAALTQKSNEPMAIQDALCMMVHAYKNLDSETSVKIMELLLKTVTSNEHHARYVAVVYANTLFPFNNTDARYICLVCASDPKLEVREQALKGLVFSESPIPSLEALLVSVDRLSKLFGDVSVKSVNVPRIGNLSMDTLVIISCFARQVMLKSCSPNAKMVDLVASLDEHLQPLSQESRADVAKTLQSGWNSPGLLMYLKWAEQVLESPQASGSLQSIASHIVTETISLGPNDLCSSYVSKKDWILRFLSAPKPETRLSMAHVYGIVGTANLENASMQADLLKTISTLIAVAEDQSKSNVDYSQGATLALGYVIGRVMYRQKIQSDFLKMIQTERVLKRVETGLETEQNDLVVTCCRTLAEMGRYGGFSDDLIASDTVKKMFSRLHHFVKNSKDLKVQEVAILAISHFSLSNKTLINPTFEFLFGLSGFLSKQPELHFNVGEAMCSILVGFGASHMKEYLDISGADVRPELLEPIDSTDANALISKILGLVTPLQSAVTKKAACIWLLCLTKYCGTLPLVRFHLISFHQAFSSLLGDKDEFTQEIASKGVGLIYEIGDQALKNELVQMLVSTFTEGKKIAAQSVSNNTELFDSNALGTSPDGSNLSTYQSILSLAADMNQPDLVYKFMSLASHHAIWNSRRGAGMGFGSIAVQAEKELEPHLPKLVPRLYRYQFDPHPKTASTMKNIWKSLVKEPGKTIDKFFKEIMKEVLSGMGDRMWRTREASCAALSDLLHGRQMEQLEDYMKDLWTMCFRALDDIKESVRAAAFLTAKTLTNITVRYCNPSYFSVTRGQKIMDTMIPFLLTNGLGSMAEEVRQFSLATILKLCKSSGVLLKPHVSDIICTFLESLSSLEPQMMNYLSFHAEKYNITQEQLDTTRLSAAKTSPIMDAIGQCVQFLDHEILVDFIPKLCVIIKKGVGLPTRAGTARFIYMITHQHPQEMKQHADVVLKSLTSAVYDRNAIVRKSFSTATGYIVKLASDEAIFKFAKQLENAYLEANDEDGRSIAPITFLEMSRIATGQMPLIHEIVMPLAFMGSRDTYPTLADIWAKVWEENTGGSTNAIKKWKKELFKACSDVLRTNPSWTMKKQVGKALTDIAKALGTETVSILSEALPLLLDSLTGRTWDGKEAVLEALTHMGIEGAPFFVANPDFLKKLEAVFLREAGKNNLSYKRYALEYIGLVFNTIDTSRYSDIRGLLVKTATEEPDEDAMDIDNDKQKPLMLAIQANAFKSIGLAFPKNSALQKEYAQDVGLLLGSSLKAQVWNIRVSILDGLQSYLDKLDGSVLVGNETLQAIFSGCASCLSDGKYRSVREKASTVLKALSIRPEAKLDSNSLSALQEQMEKERDVSICETLKVALVNFSPK